MQQVPQIPPDPNRNNPKRALKQFAIALAVVLGGVVVGYQLIKPHEGPRPRSRPTALGHYPPAPQTNAPAANTEPRR